MCFKLCSRQFCKKLKKKVYCAEGFDFPVLLILSTTIAEY